jgi:copper chaperone CopZ
MNQTYTITGMHCGACVAKVTAALRPFAEDVAVTLQPPQVMLTNAKASVAAMQTALAKVGTYGITAAAAPAAPVPSDAAMKSGGAEPGTWLETYQSLLVIVGYIAVTAFAGSGLSSGQDWMTNFMAGFFLVFSAFKFLNLAGFADAYSTYDLLAKRWHGYGFIYPFLELALGLAYLFRVAPTLTNIATVVLMGFSSLGVISALQNKRRIACACLGTVLKLPMSTVTLVEDLGMAAMAAAMLLTGGHN